MKKFLRALSFILLFTLLAGFKPGPSAGLPRFVFRGAGFHFLSLSAWVKIDSGFASVSFSAMIRLEKTDSANKFFSFSTYLRTDSLKLLVNGDEFNFSPSDNDIIMLPVGVNFVGGYYKIQTQRAFSGPPSTWRWGNEFQLSPPFVNENDRFTPILPLQFSCSVLAPKNFSYEIPKTGWEVLEIGDKRAFITHDPNVLLSVNRWYLIGD